MNSSSASIHSSDRRKSFWESLSRDEKLDSIDHEKLQVLVDNKIGWSPKGPVLNRWNSEIFSTIRQIINHPTTRHEIYRKGSQHPVIVHSLFMVSSKDWRKACPTIVVKCREYRFAERAVKLLEGPGGIRRLSLGFEFLPVESKIGLTAHQAPRNHSARTPTSLCGVRILISNPLIPATLSHSWTRATLGGIITVEGHSYGVSVAHAFLDKNQPQSHHGALAERGAEEEVVSHHESVPEAPSAESPSTEGRDSATNAQQDLKHVVYLDSQPLLNLSEPAFEVISDSRPEQSTSVATEVDETSLVRIGTLSQLDRDTDWALIDLLDQAWSSKLNKIDLPAGIEFQTDRYSSLEGSVYPTKISYSTPHEEVLVAAGVSGVHVATCTRILCGITLPNSSLMQEAWVIEEVSVPGDCGSWVVDPINGDIFAMVVASSADSEESYCILATSIFASIVGQLGGNVIRFAGSSDDLPPEMDVNKVAYVDAGNDDESIVRRKPNAVGYTTNHSEDTVMPAPRDVHDPQREVPVDIEVTSHRDGDPGTMESKGEARFTENDTPVDYDDFQGASDSHPYREREQERDAIDEERDNYRLTQRSGTPPALRKRDTEDFENTSRPRSVEREEIIRRSPSPERPLHRREREREETRHRKLSAELPHLRVERIRESEDTIEIVREDHGMTYEPNFPTPKTIIRNDDNEYEEIIRRSKRKPERRTLSRERVRERAEIITTRDDYEPKRFLRYDSENRSRRGPRDQSISDDEETITHRHDRDSRRAPPDLQRGVSKNRREIVDRAPIFAPPIHREIIYHVRYVHHDDDKEIIPASLTLDSEQQSRGYTHQNASLRRYKQSTPTERLPPAPRRQSEERLRPSQVRFNGSAGPKPADTDHVLVEDDLQDEADYLNRRALERTYVGEGYDGATHDWETVDVPPATSKVQIFGVGGGMQDLTWQRDNGVRRSKFFPGDAERVHERAYESELGNEKIKRVAEIPQDSAISRTAAHVNNERALEPHTRIRMDWIDPGSLLKRGACLEVDRNDSNYLIIKGELTHEVEELCEEAFKCRLKMLHEDMAEFRRSQSTTPAANKKAPENQPNRRSIRTPVPGQMLLEADPAWTSEFTPWPDTKPRSSPITRKKVGSRESSYRF